MLFVCFLLRWKRGFGFWLKRFEQALQLCISLWCKLRLPTEHTHLLTGDMIQRDGLETLFHAAMARF